MTSFLISSIVLTILANVGLRMFARLSRRGQARQNGPGRNASTPWLGDRSRTASRVFFPWKLMLAVSVIGTIAINVLR